MMPPIKYLVFAATLISSLQGTAARAVCATLIKGPLAIDVLQCTQVRPEQAFPLTENKYSFIRDLPPANRQVFLDSYRGLLIRGTVARSMAIRSGLSPEKGALGGEKILAFIEPKLLDCASISGKRVQAFVDEVCCEGGGEAPCLLGSSYLLKRPSLAKVQAGAKSQAKPEVQAAYQKALAAIGRRDFKQSIAILEKLRAKGPLDTQGDYLLASSYRDGDRCEAALPVLEALYKRMETGSFWSDDEIYVRRGTLLFARCLSLLSRPGEAAIILQAFLTEPKKYEAEIRDSFSHPDFGGIKTDKQYIIYHEKAVKALGRQ